MHKLSFYNWLQMQIDRDDPIGDLARDSLVDPWRARHYATPQQWEIHIKTCGSDAAYRAFERAQEERNATLDKTLDLKPDGSVKRTKRNEGLIYAKTKGHCTYCGCWLSPFEPWHFEHLVPVSRGGAQRYDNIWLACKACNSSKNAKTLEEWRSYLSRRGAERMQALLSHISRLGVQTDDLYAIRQELDQIGKRVANYEIRFWVDLTDKERADQ